MRRTIRMAVAGVVLLCLAAAVGVTPGAVAAPDEPSSVNGRLHGSQLARVAGVELVPEAADALQRMMVAAQQDGATLAVTSGYRTYERQVSLKREKGSLAATPGTSMHGWGLAVDFHTGVTDFDWLRRRAHEFGWVHPPWAQPGGSNPEPWHWEYEGPRAQPGSSTAAAQEVDPAPQLAEGELVAEARLEPDDAEPGEWFDVHHGLEDITNGPGHYPGTGQPGVPGNFAVAGYQHGHGAPLEGFDDLESGDLIRVRTPDGDEHVYEVIRGEQLTMDDGWAVGPDPLEDGSATMMTLTTSAGEDELAVVWALLGD